MSLKLESPRCVAPVGALLGEGPLWDPRIKRLLFLDIKGEKLFRYDPINEVIETFVAPGAVSALGLARGGDYVCAMRSGFSHLEIRDDCIVTTPICDPEGDVPGNRFNDGKVDPEGGFWAGTMDAAEQNTSGAFWRLSPDGTVQQIDDNYKVTNGPAFDLETSCVYFTDSTQQKIYVADFKDGVIERKRVFLSFTEADGYPDGMEVDREGCLWVAFWDGYAVRRFSRDGKLLEEVLLPVPRPTSLTLVDDCIYVTSARIGLDEKTLQAYHLSGGLFEVKSEGHCAVEVVQYYDDS